MFRTLIFILLFALSGCSAIAELETKTEAKEAKKKALEFLVGKGIDDINAKNSWREKETLHDGEDEWEPEIAKALIAMLISKIIMARHRFIGRKHMEIWMWFRF